MAKERSREAGPTTRFGALLRKHRLALGLSQEALAERASISADAVAALERGRRSAPRPATVSLLADALDLPPEARADLVAAATGVEPEPVPAASPPSDAPHRHMVTAPATPLIGREREEAAVRHLLRRDGRRPARLVTLIGPGGIGKTQLARQIAVAAQSEYRNGAIFIDLSPLTEAAAVAPAIARALAIPESTGKDPQETLIANLVEVDFLMVLDNFEQVIDAAPLVAALVDACPSLTVIATSRIALHLRAEQQLAVPPLTVPRSRVPSLAALAGSPAVRLFVSRARAIRPDFDLDEANAGPIAEICRRLDGLPLAIELAAARVRLLTPAALLERLSKRLSTLTGGARDLPERQRTMRNAIDWSYGLLEPGTARLFAAAAVFSGGATLEALETICHLDGRIDVMSELEALIDCSLMQRTDVRGEMRYSMLETIREYAAERLDDDPDGESVRRAHALYYMAMAERASGMLTGPDQTEWTEKLRADRDNLRAAIRCAITRDEAEVGQRLCAGLWRFWHRDGSMNEGRALFDEVLSMGGEGENSSLHAHAWALRGAGALALMQGDLPRGEQLARRALTHMRRLNDRSGIAKVLNNLANIVRNRGHSDQSVPLYEEALEIVRLEGDPRELAVTLNNLGTSLRNLGELDRAAALQEESLELRRELGDLWGIAVTLTNLGHVAILRGDLDRAESACEESVAINRDLGERHGVALALSVLGETTRRRGEVGRSIACFSEALTLGHEVGDTGLIATCLQGIAQTTVAIREPARGARLLAAAMRLDKAIRSWEVEEHRAVYDRMIAEIRAAMKPEEFASAWAEGERLSIEDAMREAMSIRHTDSATVSK